MAHDSSGAAGAGGAAEGAGRVESPPAPASPPNRAPDRFHQQILQLKKQQQLQQQILLQHFQQQQQQLAEQHEAQLRQHLKLWEQQKALEEQAAVAAVAAAARERRERERLEALRKKDKHDHSAIASTEVKQKLQVFLMKKQAAASANGTVPASTYRNWGVVKSSSGESITSSLSNSHPYRLPQQPPLPKYDSNDFPLRKTASEPNMLKMRLKARVIERRASPMARRLKARGAKLVPLTNIHRTNSLDSGAVGGGSSRGSPTSTAAPIREEEGESDAAATELPLFSSPSMPNISLGRPHLTPEHVTLAPVSERLQAPAPPPPAGMGGIGLAARLHKRPLGRTQSAPLPLGDPALLGAPDHPHHPHHQHPHYYLKQQIRQTVLFRAAGVVRAESQLSEREEDGEVIDLTDKRARPSPHPAPPPPPPAHAYTPAHHNDPAMHQALQVGEDWRPLCRTLSSPLVHAATTSPPPAAPSSPPTTGLAYDGLMLKHACVCGAHAPHHPEHGGRLQSVWARLAETGLAARCLRTRPRKATLEELQTCHTEAHTLLFGTNPLNRAKLEASRLSALPARSLVRLACGGVGVDSDTTWNELHTAPAARMAAGAVIDLAFKCYQGDIKNGFAVVRPPGHHAEAAQAMGFCFFNSVAVAARLLQQRLMLQRILIVDWDVHHGNGTQQIFYDDPHILYISIHRHDIGNFFPGTGAPTECGTGLGLGYNVNIAWSGGLDPPLGDADYLAAFRTIVMPIAKEFSPQMVLVSCGFDAAAGHPAPLGGYTVSPACFGHMTKELMQLADGKVVLALEGGYELPAMCDCAQECVRALLGDDIAPIAHEELARPPAPHARSTLQNTVAIQMSHWSCVKRYSALAECSALSAEGVMQSELEAAETVSAMASLSVCHPPPSSVSATNNAPHDESEEPMEQDEGK